MRISVYNFLVDKKRSKPWIVPQLSTRLRLTAGLAFARKATIGIIERKECRDRHVSHILSRIFR